MQRKLILAPVASMAVFLIACEFAGNVQNTMKEVPTRDSLIEPAIPAVASYYSDTLPCADCQGIVTRIVFNSDSTFMLTELYLGKEKVPQGGLGRWTQDHDVVVLNPDKESAQKFRLVTMGLQKLDKEGREIDSNKDYTLEEIEGGGINPREPFTTQGAYFFMADAATFTLCSIQKQFPVKQGMASHEAEKMFLDKNNKELKSIYLEADITIEEVPNMEGIQQTQVIIHRVRKKLDANKCP